MNALSSLISFRSARKGMAAPSPVSERLAAISLCDPNAFDEASGDTRATPAVETTVSSNLSGLIRRQDPPRINPAATNADIRADRLADHKAVEAFMLNRTWPRPAPTVTPIPTPENQPVAKKPRRQHTVRLEADRSEALVHLAKQSGRTFQSIMSAAIGDYLDP